jgi:hypothetical protein
LIPRITPEASSSLCCLCPDNNIPSCNICLTAVAVADISPLMPLAWTTALISSTTLPAWADEAAAPVEAAAEGVQQAAAAVTEAAADAAPAPSWLSYVGESPAKLADSLHSSLFDLHSSLFECLL